MRNQQIFKEIDITDPALANQIQRDLADKSPPPNEAERELLVDEILWSLTQEKAFARAVVKGFIALVGEVALAELKTYRRLVRNAAQEGPALGKLMAEHLVPVIRSQKLWLLDRFLAVVRVMQTKGNYTLRRPLTALDKFVEANDDRSVMAYLDVLVAAFEQNLTYNQSQHLSRRLPQAALCLPRRKRPWQLEAVSRVIRIDLQAAQALFDGLDKGLVTLRKDAFQVFVDGGIQRLQSNREQGLRFLGLNSTLSLDSFHELQVSVPLPQVQVRLNRYLKIRTGRSFRLLSFAQMPKAAWDPLIGGPAVCSDGKCIYLPDEIESYPSRSGNQAVYKVLANLEAAYYEFGTLEFDLEKLLDLGERDNARYCTRTRRKNASISDTPDLVEFFSFFPIPALAEDLFTVFEHGRINRLLTLWYPGLAQQMREVLQHEINRSLLPPFPYQLIYRLYAHLVAHAADMKPAMASEPASSCFTKAIQLFENLMNKHPEVETAALLVDLVFEKTRSLFLSATGGQTLKADYQPLQFPFNRRIRPDLYWSAFSQHVNIARRLHTALKQKGISVPISSLRRQLIAQKGQLSREELQVMAAEAGPQIGGPQNKEGLDLSWLSLAEILGLSHVAMERMVDHSLPSYWYKEWDCHLGDYLPRHVRVLERLLQSGSSRFYEKVLEQYSGLIKKIRTTFELLRPEGIQILRPWIEGDEFDYRALLDFALDKKAGKMPSDRLYIKRVKQQRDVAVLFLVDVSRSTANHVCGSEESVLDVEKKAIVLFCEALEVVGDRYSIAGFSGTGRLGVDYYHIKGFDEHLTPEVRQRIDAMQSQRSTRMGAAIRHATFQLEQISAKVRILLILGDGFPNDTNYKRDYAIRDTRRAIIEARSKEIHTKAIAINLPGDPQLDELYGAVHHLVISDVRELPDKLLRIYSALTRN